jgi:hypothetical protein
VNLREAMQGYFFDRLEKAAVPIRLLRFGLFVFFCLQSCVYSSADPTPELKASIIPGMTMRTPKKVTILDASTPPKAIQVDGWLYHFTVLLKNISNHPLRVTTESLGVSGATEQATQTFRLSSLEDMRV